MDDFNTQNLSNRNPIRVSNATIQRVVRDRGTTFVTISYDDCPACRNQNQVVTLIINRDTKIRNARGRNISASDLETGMVIDASFSQAMTRSIPPQAQAFEIRVKNTPLPFDTTYGRIVDINTREQFIQTISNANPTSIIRFNISPQTRILDLLGRPIPLSRLVPGLRVRVQHATFMTASIPPQTTAFVIQIVR